MVATAALPLNYVPMVDGEFLLNTAVLLNRFLFDFSGVDAHSLRILSVSVPRLKQKSRIMLQLVGTRNEDTRYDFL